MTETIQTACEFLDRVKEVLKAKNEAYGNSAANPIRIFARSPNDEQLKVRIDDKLSRIARGKDFQDEDVLVDLVGYIALLYAVKVQR